jgi:hypothetical protein
VDFPAPTLRADIVAKVQNRLDFIDMDKLRGCLQPMDPTQAAWVLHAFQTMQAIKAML